MIKVNNVSKHFGARTVLDGVSFTVAGHAGIVGPNGSGKTTLLNIVAGELSADAGSVDVGSDLRLGYLQQGYAHDQKRPVGDVFPGVFSALSAGRRLEELARKMATEADPAQRRATEDEYSALVVQMEVAPAEAEVDELRRALSLRPVDAGELVGELSGGEQAKLGLIEVVVSHPNGLLLDEPTNNLDLPALDWLDRYLDGFDGPALIVSHDRALLDRHVEVILEIDSYSGKLEAFPGNYTNHAEEKARREANVWDRYRQQRRSERGVRQEIRRIKAKAQVTETRTINDHYRRKAKKVARRALVLQRRLERQLESGDHVEKPKASYGLKADISPEQRSGDRMLAVAGVTIEVPDRTLLADVEFEVGWGECVVLSGPNGCGKTTLLRAIQGLHQLSSGSVKTSPSVCVGYLAQEEEETTADGSLTPLEAIRAVSPISETDARRFLHRFLFTGDEPLTPVERLSYGERKRLALACLVLSGANLLLLDEPTNHLDIPSREAFELALGEYRGAMIVVTHDRYFIDRFADRMLVIEAGRVLTGIEVAPDKAAVGALERADDS
ncbi:MAG: ABC-F family ATP-binding cassette domain-containing protein [Chloroflexi bacterium]|nr:ABC-F family ATP-binding cassette domain-containing protein [Chloroflexota bacterium]